MFSLDEIKEIQKKYIYNSENNEIKLRNKADSSSKRPEDLTTEDKNRIISACFVFKVIKDMERGLFGTQGKENQVALDEIQTEFYEEALKPGIRRMNLSNGISDKATDKIFAQLVSPRDADRNDAEIYLQYVLAEQGKKATNIQRGLEGGLQSTISYDIEEVRKENHFKQQLDPNNPIYIQPQKKLDLTPKQLAHRKEIVERLILDYRKMEHDEWYESRTQKEENDMQRIANIINKNDIINSSIKGPGLFRILIAAQNLSLEGEQDFLEEILKQPAVNDALLELKKSGQVHTIHTEAQENEQNGRVNNNGLLDEHSLTHGEKNIREANQFISEHPNAVSVAKQKLSERNSFLIKYGDTESMKKARLVEIVARTQGKSITRTTDANKNRILQVDDEKEQSK